VRAAARAVLWLALIGLAVGGATLAGCGQKGQLYLPSQKKKVPPTQQPPGTPGATPAPDATPSAPAPAATS